MSAEALVNLSHAYLEPHRHYHTLSHIVWMLERARHWEFPLTSELLHAIWYHDCVYRVGVESGVNERQSADKFTADFPQAESREVELAILSTILHIPLSSLARFLIDLDLAILAEEFNIENSALCGNSRKTPSPAYPYDTYLVGIRKEYSAYNDRAWMVGRTRWIRGMLKRKRIFHTVDGFRDCELKARENLEMELRLYELQAVSA